MVQACGLNEALPLKSFMDLNTIYVSIASVCCNKFNGIHQKETGTQREVVTEEKRGENNRQTDRLGEALLVLLVASGKGPFLFGQICRPRWE